MELEMKKYINEHYFFKNLILLILKYTKSIPHHTLIIPSTKYAKYHLNPYTEDLKNKFSW